MELPLPIIPCIRGLGDVMRAMPLDSQVDWNTAVIAGQKIGSGDIRAFHR
jgi:hypothetical protein